MKGVENLAGGGSLEPETGPGSMCDRAEMWGYV